MPWPRKSSAMPKKAITGKTKLSNVVQSEPISQEPLNLIFKKDKVFPRSFRLKEADLERLRTITKGVNDISASRVSDTNVLRALFLLGMKISPEKILNAYRDLL